VYYTHRSKERQREGPESARSESHRPLGPHDEHPGEVFVPSRLVVPVALIHRVEYCLALLKEELSVL
jgi:hypothetical protein